MKYFHAVVDRLGRWFENMAVIILAFMMMLVVTDVILRIFGHPIIGTYEMVMILAGPLVAFAIPQTSIENQHISVDALTEQIERKSLSASAILFACTKALGMILFMVLGWFCMEKGIRMFEKGDISDARHIPLYPVAFMMGACCFAEVLVLLVQLFKKFTKEPKHG
jgi:TRAP-type C4-dicarboxylate transport system permease small subunit